jgi:class 3 adenylate cyclase
MGIPIDLFWDEPRFVRFAKRLGGFSRVVMADLRGVGASGGDVRDSVVGAIGDSDVTSVLDAVGCQRVVLFGTGLGGPAAIRYATHHPERVQALVLTVPTLVLHRVGNLSVPIGVGRYLADQIPGASYFELPGDDAIFFVGDTDALLDEIEEFLTGSRQAPGGDVVSATILFTDIVASTEQSARMGHRGWTAVTDEHDAMIRASLARYRGREVKTTGDGFLATFDAATRAVRAATEIATAARGIGLEVRAGLHVGEIEMRSNDLAGLAVSIAKRICDLAGAGEVLVSETVKGHLVGSDMAFSERGTHVLKGVPDLWRLYAIEC